MNHRDMRRSFQELTNIARINDLLTTAKVGYLGLADEEGTYVVPLNFVWKDEKIYFHGSDQGRKTAAIATSNRVCFTVAEDFGTIADTTPANIGTAYTSVMVFGRIKVLDALGESTDVLQALLEKFVPGYFEQMLPQRYIDAYRSSLGSKTVVYCLEPDQITAKEAGFEQDQLFYPGRKQKDDLKKNC